MARGRNKARPNPDGEVAISDYRHAGVSRKNNPPASIAAEGWTPYIPQVRYSYSPRLPPELRFDETGAADQLPELLARARQGPLTDEEIRVLAAALRMHEPWLEWAGKREARGFALDPVALHIHERVSTQALLKVATRQDVTRDLFADPEQEYREAVQFYQHDVDWANRLILGDSLQVMASLARREDLAGKVQMIYMDPPYGIKFASNFQPEIGRRDVKDKEQDLTREPEMVKAYRDTWTLGIHSYLSYLRDRLMVARELLADSGSIFIQIGDENVHLVRNLLDEVFGSRNFVGSITVQKTTSATNNYLPLVADHLLWFARDITCLKYKSVYKAKTSGEDDFGRYNYVSLPDGEKRAINSDSENLLSFPQGSQFFAPDSLQSASLGREKGEGAACWFPVLAEGREFFPTEKSRWKTNEDGMLRLKNSERLFPQKTALRYIRYLEDFPVSNLNNIWSDLSGAADRVYVVQTTIKIIQRCLLMTTDPGDLVLDPTCGSGTTAHVAEQWGRRWITIDTSRVAIAIARQRLLTARFDYYHLRDVSQGVTSGFRYKTVPHITLRSIAQNSYLDPIFAKYEPILDSRLAACNAVLETVDDSLRSKLQSKLLLKQRNDGRKAITEADRRRWRAADYRGASNVTKALFQHWTREDRPRRLFFCQREAVETLIYLVELRLPGKSGRTGFRNFEVSDDDLRRLMQGTRPTFDLPQSDYFPTLVDIPADTSGLPLRRLGCKMATGAGKTVVMAMLITWAFCNRGVNPQSQEFPQAVLVCCPNLTVKERLQVLRPDRQDNYYTAFDLVPIKYRPLLQKGKVLITNWHAFAPESEHKEGERTYAVVNKGPETPAVFARRVLGDLTDRMPIMVLNDEGHHCWRRAPDANVTSLGGDEKANFEAEVQEATVWIDGLDRLNNALGNGTSGIAWCVDLSATPFYIKGSGHPEGRPFPWLVSDFGLVDAIECGIVKIPRLPVLDTTGRPDPKYFKLWEAIKDGLQPAELLPGRARKPKPEVIYRETEGALQQIAGQWVERFRYLHEATPGREHIPPVLIIVCDNTDIAEVFYRYISGEREVETITEEDVEDVLAEDAEDDTPKRSQPSKKPKKTVVYGEGRVYPEYFANTPVYRRTIRIDSKLLADAERADANKGKRDAAEELRQIITTVGRPGQPGEHVRCVVSVALLKEGWDANNVTQILGIRAFGSQLLCEQVVGRGLRRMDYTPDPVTGLLTEEYVDVYGIPFSVIPFKGRPAKKSEPDDKPTNYVRALPERAAWEMRFPVVEGHAFALRKNAIHCDIDKMDPLILEPNREPTATFVAPTVGYQVGASAQAGGLFTFIEQSREDYYAQTHLQTIMFQVARLIVEDLTNYQQDGSDQRRRVLRLQSRHQLFPQVYRYVEAYVQRKIHFQGCHPCELGLQKYVERLVERLRDAIIPDDSAGESPLLPLLNRYKPVGTTAEVDFKTTRPCFAIQHSHLNQMVADTATWESSAACKLEQLAQRQIVRFYVRNDNLGCVIPYEYMHVEHSYEPDFLVRLNVPGKAVTVILEVKGYADDRTQQKHQATQRWLAAVNTWGKLGAWDFHVCRNPQTLDKELMYVHQQWLSAPDHR